MRILIEAQGIHKTYVLPALSLHILKGGDLKVHEGQSVAVIGKSGAGKSTLLHILGTLDRPDQGRIRIGDRDVTDAGPRERALIRSSMLGFVFQSYHLLPEMDVLENVLLPAMACRGYFLGARAARRRALELLESVGLADRADHTPLELSGGEQQRVALARALMNDPKIVLADEPTGNLDDATGTQILSRLFSLTRERGHALVIVTHSESVAGMCDSVLRLRDGALVPE